MEEFMNTLNIEQFFPAYLTFVDSEIINDKATLYFESNRSECTCPACNKSSTKPSTRYTRTVQDKSLFDVKTMLEIKLRKYACTNPNCSKKIFAERIDDFALPRQQQTNRLEEIIKIYGLTHAANSVARELKLTSVSISSSTVLRHSKKYDHDVSYEDITAVAVDDFCLKKKSDTLR